jgi:hypothetical protein
VLPVSVGVASIIGSTCYDRKFKIFTSKLCQVQQLCCIIYALRFANMALTKLGQESAAVNFTFLRVFKQL